MKRLGGRYVPRGRPGRQGARGDKGDPGVQIDPQQDGSLVLAPTDPAVAPAAVAVPAPPVQGDLSWTENPDGTFSLQVTPAGGTE